MIILSPPPKVLLRRPRPKTSLGALSFVGVTPRLCAASILALFAAGTPPPVLASPDGEACTELGERTTRPIRPTSLPVWRILAPLVPLRFRRRPPLCLPPLILAARRRWREQSLEGKLAAQRWTIHASGFPAPEARKQEGASCYGSCRVLAPHGQTSSARGTHALGWRPRGLDGRWAAHPHERALRHTRLPLPLASREPHSCLRSTPPPQRRGCGTLSGMAQR